MGPFAVRVALLAGLVVAAPAPSQASTEVVLAGQASTASGSCLVLSGFASGAASRSRWAGGYWEATTTPQGVCSDTDPHFDPVIVCIQTEQIGTPGSPEHATIVHIGATGPARSPYQFKIIDRAQGVDAFGVVAAPPASGPCGTSEVVTSPVVAGGFVAIAS